MDTADFLEPILEAIRSRKIDGEYEILQVKKSNDEKVTGIDVTFKLRLEKLKPEYGFKTNDDKGFYITFKNGYTVSVQFGYGNYCDNFTRNPNVKNPESKTAEIAIWDKDVNLLTSKWSGKQDDVEGYLTPKQVLDALVWAEAQE